MWLFTEGGFVSAVRNRNNSDQLVVRARDKKSLGVLAEATKQEIKFTPYADYPYRLYVGEKEFRTFVDESVRNLDYDNFKSRVVKTRGANFVDALHDVWATMHKVEDLEASGRWDDYPTTETIPGFEDSEPFPDWEPDEKS
jgi:hypothetical protein